MTVFSTARVATEEKHRIPSFKTFLSSGWGRGTRRAMIAQTVVNFQPRKVQRTGRADGGIPWRHASRIPAHLGKEIFALNLGSDRAEVRKGAGETGCAFGKGFWALDSGREGRRGMLDSPGLGPSSVAQAATLLCVTRPPWSVPSPSS